MNSPTDLNKNDFYNQAFTIFKNVKDKNNAKEILKEFAEEIANDKSPLLKLFKKRFEFLSIKELPTGEDVENAFQALHFDDGHPFIYKENQKIFLMTTLFLPPEIRSSKAETRILPIKDIFKKLDGKDLKRRIINYTKKYGDGWSYYKKGNSGRICCFSKILDALNYDAELPDIIDWFYDINLNKYPNNFDKEKSFI